MRKRSITSFILTVIVAISFYSCDNFLETEPTTNVRLENAITDISSMRTTLLGAYSKLKNSNYRGKYALLIPDLLSDNVFTSVRNSGRGVTLDNYDMLATEDWLEGLWVQAYAMAANASLLITNGSDVEVASGEVAEKNQILGEAHALIGLAYFDLVRFYAQPYNYSSNASHLGVPIVTKVESDIAKLDFPARSTVATTYDWIVDNLIEAINIMPEDLIIKGNVSNNIKTRFSKNAVKALLAKVYLYMEEWEPARDMADEVINSQKYTLLSNTQVIDGFKEQNNSETILEVAFSRTDNPGSNSLAYIYNLSGYADQQATEDLWDSYDVDDARRGFIRKDARANAENPAYVATKYHNIVDYDENYKILRLADMHLIRAEANAHIPGGEQDARDDLDEIRLRANPTVGSSTETGQALLDKILLERRLEFAFEGERLFDLKRNNKQFTKYRSPLTVGKPIERVVDYPGKGNLHEKTILAIPQREIDVNENLQGQQNPGY